MHLEITLKNYRCFADTKPARFEAREGFTAFLGVNNSGKSSLLKFFFEFRGLFAMLAAGAGNISSGPKQQPIPFSYPPTVQDTEELFCNLNTRDLEITLKVVKLAASESRSGVSFARELVVTVPRQTNTYRVEMRLDKPFNPNARMNWVGYELQIDGCGAFEFGPLLQLCRQLSETLYVGSFRNAINIGTKEDYFDIRVGQAFIQEWRRWKTGVKLRDNEAALQLTEDIRRIFEFEALEVNPSEDNQTLQVFVNRKSYKLSGLGAGLAQFILVLANAATKRPALILIDEPELNLHPSLQLDFLTTLHSYARNGVLSLRIATGLRGPALNQSSWFATIRVLAAK